MSSDETDKTCSIEMRIDAVRIPPPLLELTPTVMVCRGRRMSPTSDSWNDDPASAFIFDPAPVFICEQSAVDKQVGS